MRRLRALPLLIAGLLTNPMARGQTLNYGQFEGLFDEPVTMSATGKPERVSDTPVMMDVITAEDIKRSGARDIPTLLGRLPGVDIYHGSVGTEEVSMGGYIQIIGARVMVLLNGRQIYLGSFGSVFWSSLPVELDEIRQIEVIRGPQSALYGFNAVDGVINIITFDPAVEDLNSVRLRGGNAARRDGSVSLTQALASGVGLRVTAADDHAHDEGAVGSPFSVPHEQDPHRQVLSMALTAHIPDGGLATFEAAHSDIEQRSVPAGTSQFFYTHDKTDSLKADYTVDTSIGRLGAKAALTLSDMPDAYNGSLGQFRLHDHHAEAEVFDLLKLTPADSVRFALDGHNENMNVVNFSSGTISGRLIAGSAMWEHQFSPDLSVVNAVRYDDLRLGRRGGNLPGDIYTDGDFDRSVQGTSVNSSLFYRATSDDTFRGSWSRGLSLPSLLNFGQLALFMPQEGGNYYYGDPYLRPSAVYEERLSWDHHFGDLEALLRLSAYHEQTMKTITTVTVPTPTPLSPYCNPYNPLTAQACVAQQYQQGAGVVVNGLQVQFDHKSSAGLMWGFNYSLERLSAHNAENPTTENKLQSTLPVHKVNANVGYGLGQWTADLRLFYASGTRGGTVILDPYPTPVYQEIKNYVTMAPRLGWSPLDNLTVELTADNLWPYKDNLAQRMPVIYALSLIAHY